MDEIFHVREDFHFGDEDIEYLSSPQDSEQMLGRVLRDIHGPCVALDAFAGAGGNTMHLMCRLQQGSTVYAVQRVAQGREFGDERARFRNLRENVDRLSRSMHGAVKVEVFGEPIREFVERIATTRGLHSPLLMLVDPPWYLGGSPATNQQLVEFLRENVFFSQQGFTPRYIVFKLPDAMDDDMFCSLLGPVYRRIDTQHIRGRYYSYAFQYVQPIR